MFFSHAQPMTRPHHVPVASRFGGVRRHRQAAGAGLALGALALLTPLDAMAAVFITYTAPTQISSADTSVGIEVAVEATEAFETSIGCTYTVTIAAFAPSLEGSTLGETEVSVPAEGAFSAGATISTNIANVPVDAAFIDNGEFEVQISDVQDSCLGDGGFPVDVDTASSIVTVSAEEPPVTEEPTLTSRQERVAETVDGACAALREIPEADRTSGQNDLIAVCDSASESSNPGAIYDGLAPEEVSAQGRASMQTMRQQLANVGSRITELRAGSSGFSARGFSVALNGEAVPVHMLSGALGGGASEDDSVGSDILAFSNFGVFINGSAAFGRRESTSNEQGFSSDTLGLTAGADYRFSPETVAGVALGYTRTDSDLRNNAGGVDVDGYSLSIYGTHFLPRSFYVDGIATVGRNRYDTTRTIFSGPGGQSAKAKPDGNEYALGLNLGYDYYDGPWTVSFQSSLDYVRVEIDSYRERASNPNNPGAGTMLAIDDQTVESETAELAIQLSYTQNHPWGVLLYSTRWGVEREFSDDARRINARFLEDPTNTSFSLFTDDPDSTYINLGAGLTAQFARGRSAYLFMESVEGRSGFSLYQIDVGVRLEF